MVVMTFGTIKYKLPTLKILQLLTY